MLRAGIAGVTGYTGTELLSILDDHPDVVVTRAYSQRNAGVPLRTVLPRFSHVDLVMESLSLETIDQLDVLFLAVPHATTHAYLSTFISAYPQLKIIDLSADFRLDDPEVYRQYYEVDHSAPDLLKSVVYGLPELFADDIASASVCANPGCYATASILGLYPVSSYLRDVGVVIDAKSGVSGAGKSLKESSLYCEANESVSAYGTGSHRHEAEIHMVTGLPVVFSPHLIPMERGIMCSIYFPNVQGWSQDQLIDIYTDVYSGKPFVQVDVDQDRPSTALVSGTNRCVIMPRVLPKSDSIVVFSMIDNLQKGAAGQAVQNMNLMYGFDEGRGLRSI